ncbi:hypothetical protein C5688_13720 [Methylocystis sp. MitZ-2018]|nr:hypothetical protein C5688_13720 [Methylocystis sp. MitZ-2018]
MTQAAFRRRCIAEAYRALAEFYDDEARRLEAREREDAIIDALKLYEGALTSRVKQLETDLDRYLGAAWLRERGRGSPPAEASPKRRALHRIARSRDGEGLRFRRMFDIASKCSRARLRLHLDRCDF